MIELTTGVIFLMSSLYGTGNANGQVQVIGINNQSDVQTENISTKSSFIASNSVMKDRKAMEAYLKKEFADTPLLVDIARCESTFRHLDADGTVIRGRVNSADVGVMQINEKYHGEMSKKLGVDIYTLEGNIEYAKRLYAESGSKPWKSSSPCWSKELAVNI